LTCTDDAVYEGVRVLNARLVEVQQEQLQEEQVDLGIHHQCPHHKEILVVLVLLEEVKVQEVGEVLDLLGLMRLLLLVEMVEMGLHPLFLDHQ
jgi:hypothetical protein